MKDIFKIALIATAVFAATQSFAQNVKDDARKVGHKTSEVAAKGKADVVDRTYKNKVGPQGQKIHIDKFSKYYYINKRGHKVYVKRSELRDKR